MKTKYNIILSSYFTSKPLYLDEPIQKKPNIRKLVEQPWQETKAEMWDKVTDTLCNLDFIQVKSAAKMTYELVNDFNEVLEAIPDNADNIRREKERQERMGKYTRDLILYAKGAITSFDFPESITPWTDEQINVDIERIKTNPTNVDKLNSFNHFLGNEAGNLQKFADEIPNFSTQQAWNYSDVGPVGNAATYAPKERLDKLMLCISSIRPPWDPLPISLKILTGFTSSVIDISMTPDCKQAFTISSDGNCIFWDLKSGKPIKSINSPISGVSAFAITQNWEKALMSDTFKIILWDLETNSYEILKDLIALGWEDRSSITDVAITPDGRFAVIAYSDGNIGLFDFEHKEPETFLFWHFSRITAIAITPDGEKAATAYVNKTCIVWNLTSREPIKFLYGHEDSVRSIAITPDGKLAISGSFDNSCILWNLEGGKTLLKKLKAPNGINDIAITPDGKKAIAASDNYACIIWDLEKSKIEKILSCHNSRVKAITISPDGKYAMSALDDKTCIIWNLENSKSLPSLKGHNDDIKAIAVNSYSKSAVTASVDRNCILWDIESGTPRKILSAHKGIVNDVKITPDGKKLISASDDSTCIIWDLISEKSEKVLVGHDLDIDSVVITPDGKQLITSSDDGTSILWSIESGERLKTLKRHDFEEYTVTINAYGGKEVHLKGNLSQNWEKYTTILTPDGKRSIVSENTYKTCIIWDLESGKYLRTLKGHTYCINSIAITPDGKYTITASDDDTCILWNLKSGRSLRILVGHEECVIVVVVTQDGTKAISGSLDKTCIIWDLKSGKRLKTLKAHTGSINAITVTPDGKHIATASDDKTCIIWNIENGNIIARFVANQSLSCCSIHNTTLLLGGLSGNLILLKLPDDCTFKARKIANSVKIWDSSSKEYQQPIADCPSCGHRFPPSISVLETIDIIRKQANLRPDQSPCLELPNEAWEEPSLLSECPKCGEKLKFNPFIAGGAD